MMTPEELDAALKKNEKHPERAIGEIANCLGELEGMEELIGLRDKFIATAQDFGFSVKELDDIQLGISKIIIAMSVWNKLKSAQDDKDHSLRKIRSAIVEASAKGELSDFMKCFASSVGIIAFASHFGLTNDED